MHKWNLAKSLSDYINFRIGLVLDFASYLSNMLTQGLYGVCRNPNEFTIIVCMLGVILN